ncbi:MAG: DUF1587 domain-containing protein, partial [Acidobacteria bacterium]|nr:DUF1587 domain-containing protein [Acidobacteriota bacterium]
MDAVERQGHLLVLPATGEFSRHCRHRCRTVIVASVMKAACLAFALIPVVLSGAQSGPVDVKQVLSRYCVGCHNAKLKTGGLVVDPAAADNPGSHPETWEKIVRRMRARHMPPDGAPRPEEAVYRQVVSRLENRLDAASAAKPDPGRTATFRRLTRTEYQNVIRDLLAVEVDVTALLPADEVSHGFDNVTVGDLSPTLLERYLTAARKVSRLAVGITPRTPGGDTFRLPPDLTQEEHFEQLPLGTRGGLSVRYTFPADATYEVQVRLARDRNEHVEGLGRDHAVEIMLDGARLGLFTVRPPSRGTDHSAVDRQLNVRIPVKAGPHVVSAAFPKQPSVLLETERQPYVAHFNMDRHPRITPAVYSITVNGPYDVKGPGDTPSRKLLFACKPAAADEEHACAQRIVGGLARRAFRRPVTAVDLAGPMRFFKEGRASGGFDHGVELAVRAILVSPEFLFRVEKDPPGVARGGAYRISDLDFASRLSFFLWSSIPDAELLDAAVRGDLRNPAKLEAQVKRMIADLRSAV